MLSKQKQDEDEEEEEEQHEELDVPKLFMRAAVSAQGIGLISFVAGLIVRSTRQYQNVFVEQKYLGSKKVKKQITLFDPITGESKVEELEVDEAQYADVFRQEEVGFGFDFEFDLLGIKSRASDLLILGALFSFAGGVDTLSKLVEAFKGVGGALGSIIKR